MGGFRCRSGRPRRTTRRGRRQGAWQTFPSTRLRGVLRVLEKRTCFDGRYESEPSGETKTDSAACTARGQPSMTSRTRVRDAAQRKRRQAPRFLHRPFGERAGGVASRGGRRLSSRQPVRELSHRPEIVAAIATCRSAPSRRTLRRRRRSPSSC